MGWQGILRGCDFRCLVDLILCIGTESFRQSIQITSSNGDSSDLLMVIDFMESAQNERLITMLLEAIESLSEQEKRDKDAVALFKQIDQLFEQANIPQRRLMLSLTCS